MLSRSFVAFGPDTAAAGFTGRTWLTTSSRRACGSRPGAASPSGPTPSASGCRRPRGAARRRGARDLALRTTRGIASRPARTPPASSRSRSSGEELQEPRQCRRPTSPPPTQRPTSAGTARDPRETARREGRAPSNASTAVAAACFRGRSRRRAEPGRRTHRPGAGGLTRQPAVGRGRGGGPRHLPPTAASSWRGCGAAR